MFFYGRYTNANLMTDYGFCFRGNKYDQYDVSLELRPKSVKPADFITLEWWREDEVKVVHLKVDILDETLMSFLRLLLSTTAQPGHDLFTDQIHTKMIDSYGEAKDLDLERQVIKLYR